MSTLSTLKSVHESPPDSQKYLGNLHSKIIKDLKINKEDLSLNAQALKLQEFLRVVKYYQSKNFNGETQISDAPFSSLWSVLEQQTLMEKLYEIHPQIFSNRYFTKGGNSFFEIGMNLENGLSQIVKAFEAIGTKSEYGNSGFISGVGGQHTQIPDLIGETNEIIKEEFNNFYKITQQEARKYRGDGEIHRYASFMNSVPGKIDNVGLFGELTFISECTQIEQDIILALQESTFTAKNYISENDIHFGKTNPFRVFMTVTDDSGEVAIIRFYRMYNCFETHSFHTQAPTYFYRIRAIYELTGHKMRYVNNLDNPIIRSINGGFAKFLIWNSPFRDVLYVIPTQNIIREIFEKGQQLVPANYQDALYGEIAIPQTSLMEAAIQV